MGDLRIVDFAPRILETHLRDFAEAAPWSLTEGIERVLAGAMSALSTGWTIERGVARHGSALIETGAVVKAPAILGPRSFVAATAYLRGGVYLDEDVIIGPACEIKSSVFLKGAKAAHLSFVGDSIVGAAANIEAGAMIANYRNETTGGPIAFFHEGRLIETGVEKFGALIGDRARIGANAVIAPGAVLTRNSVTPRLALVDQAARA